MTGPHIAGTVGPGARANARRVLDGAARRLLGERLEATAAAAWAQGDLLTLAQTLPALDDIRRQLKQDERA